MTEETVTQTSDSSSGGGFSLTNGNIWLVALLIIQAGLAAYMLWPNTTVGEAGVPLLGEIDSSAVTAMSIVEGDNEIGFEKAGSDWAVAGTGGFLTNEDSDGANKVMAALDKLIGIDGDRLVTKTPSSHKRLQVAEDDFVRKVTVTTADGDQTLYIGSSAGSGATHVRLDGSNEAYLTDQISSFELNTNASSWIDTLYFSVESNDVTAFTLQNANGTFSFERGVAEAEGSPAPWILADLSDGESLEQSSVTTLINLATNLRMTEPVGTSVDGTYSLGAGSSESGGASVTMTVQETGEDANPEPQQITLQIGASEEDGTDYYAKASNSDFVVKVSQYNGNQLLDKTREDFLAEPEEDAEAGSGSDGATGAAGSTDSGSVFEAFPLTETLSITETGGGFTVTDGITTTETASE